MEAPKIGIGHTDYPAGFGHSQHFLDGFQGSHEVLQDAIFFDNVKGIGGKGERINVSNLKGSNRLLFVNFPLLRQFDNGLRVINAHHFACGAHSLTVHIRLTGCATTDVQHPIAGLQITGLGEGICVGLDRLDGIKPVQVLQGIRGQIFWSVFLWSLLLLLSLLLSAAACFILEDFEHQR